MKPEGNVQNEAASATNVASMTTPEVLKKDNMFENAPKKSNGMLIGLVLCLILAIGGIGFGVWAMMDGGQQKTNYDKQVSDLKKQNSELLEKCEVIGGDASVDGPVSNNVDKALAQNIIAPYIDSFNYLSNVFDYDFSDDVKVEIAYKNLWPGRLVDGYVYYSYLNGEYKRLFGGELEKRDYSVGHSDSFTFEGGDMERFKVSEYEGGGAGLGMFSVVKDAYYDGEKLVVEVYHDVIRMCNVDESDYCLKINSGGVSGGLVTNSFEGSNLSDLVSNYEDKIPVYKMIFVTNNGHYVLNSVARI